MFENYLKYLEFINEKLTNFFERQKPYIFCKKGCAKCCKNAEFPYSKIEADYLFKGVMEHDKETRKIFADRISKILEDKAQNKEEIFRYDCPFLIDDVCSVYEHRGVICRSFGLMYFDENGKNKMPFCCFEGANYSNVYDPKTKLISSEMYKKLEVQEEPLAFNVGYKFLTNEDFGLKYNFEFGEKKALIGFLGDWVEKLKN